MAEKEKTVYILGAGFSRAFSEMTNMEVKFPVMNDFMEGIDDISFYDKDYPETEIKAFSQWIKEHYDAKAPINIEELLTMLEIMSEGYYEVGNRNQIERKKIFASMLIHTFKNYIANRLEIIPELDQDNSKLFKSWFNNTLKNNSPCRFISFNIDSLFEDLNTMLRIDAPLYLYTKQTLTEIGYYHFSAFQYYGSSSSNFYLVHPLLMKLHGSIDWFCCSNTKCNDHNIIHYELKKIDTNDNKRVIDAHVPNTICPNCGELMDLVILPPQMVKIIDKYPRLRVMWNFASTALMDCDRIIVIGYSFPLTDTRTTYMMMSALQGREKKVKWTIVDPNAKGENEKPGTQMRLIEILPKHKKQIQAATIFDGNNALLDYLTDFAEKNPAD